MKKTILITTFLIGLLLMVGCSSTKESSTNTIQDEQLSEDASTTDKDERSRFIQANVETGCYAMTGGQIGTDDEEDDPYNKIVQKYGFASLEELESLASKYSDTQTEVGKGMSEECPEVMQGIVQIGEDLPSDTGAPSNLDDWKS